MDNIEIVDLCKNVTVYKNAYKLSKELINAFHTAPHGKGNYTLTEEDAYHNYGRKRRCMNKHIDYAAGTYEGKPPSEDDIAFGPIANLLATYDECLKDFQLRHNFQLNIEKMTELEVRYYEPNTGCGYHSDYQGYRPLGDAKFQDGEIYPNYSVTLNCYLNSDYEGGALQFKINEGTASPTESDLYKPQEGDIILFPSAFPYRHKISTVRESRRWFTNFMLVEKQEPTWQFSVNSGPIQYEYYGDYAASKAVVDSNGEEI